jgi:hypothetical protein
MTRFAVEKALPYPRERGAAAFPVPTGSDKTRTPPARIDAMNATPPVHRSTSPLAIVSLVAGIAAWSLLPVIGAIVAIVCGHLARGEIRRSQGQLEGDGLAIAGLVLGYVQIAFGLIVLLFAIAAVLLGLSIGFGSSFFH